MSHRRNRISGLSVATLILVVYGLTMLSCTTRERNNPLDPGNPATGGTPADFSASAGNQIVELRWFPENVPGLQGYELLRKGPSDPSHVPITGTLLSPSTSTFADLLVGNDSTYTYQLKFVLADGSRSEPSSAISTPGPGAIWVGDTGADFVIRLAPDGRARKFGLPGLNNPVEISVDEIGGLIWGVSNFEGFVAVWRTDGTFLGVAQNVGVPFGVAARPGLNSAWVTDAGLAELVLINTTGAITNRVPGFARPFGVAYDPSRAMAWVTDRTARELVAVDNNASVVNRIQVEHSPWKIAIDPNVGSLWITYSDAGIVEKRDANGNLEFRISSLPRPFDITVDPLRDRVWVSLSDSDAVIGFDRSGAEQVRITGLVEPRGVSFDSRTGDVWVSTLGRFIGDGSILGYTAQGVFRSGLSGFTSPYTVGVESVSR